MSDALKAATPNFGFGLINFDFPLWSSYEHRNWRNLDGILAAALGGFITRGVWTNSTAYIQGDRVTDDDTGTVFFCLIAHTSAATGTFSEDRTANPTYWQSSVEVPKYRGNWTTGVAYAPNDIVSEGTGYYFCITPHTSSGSFAADAVNWVLMFDYGGVLPSTDFIAQGRLVFVSGTQIKLAPFNGNKLTIGNGVYTIPSAGVTLANTGIGANTTRYIFAYMDGATMKLEHTDTNNPFVYSAVTGMPVKYDDNSRTLVGLVITTVGTGLFQDDLTGRCVASYFNRRSRVTRVALASDYTVTGANNAAIISSMDIRVATWIDDIVRVRLTGSAKLSSGSVAGFVAVIANAVNASPTIIADTTSRLVSSEYLTQVGQHFTSVQVYMANGTTGTSNSILEGGTLGGLNKTTLTAESLG